jgi:DNA-binding NtrC family response regulator
MQSGALLVVDDDEIVAGSLSQSLSCFGWAVDVAHDRGAAEELLGQRAFDAMILDLRLREGDGLSLMEDLLRKTESTRPVTILLSGHLDIPTTVRAVRAGAMDVIEKPVEPVDLDQRLRAALSERERQTQPPQASASSMPPSEESADGTPSEPLRALERRVIEQVWVACGKNLSAAARRLGLPRTTLRDRLKKYGLR